MDNQFKTATAVTFKNEEIAVAVFTEKAPSGAEYMVFFCLQSFKVRNDVMEIIRFH